MISDTTRHASAFIENLPVRVKAFAASSVLLICMISLGGIAYVTLDRSQDGLNTLSGTILPKQRAFAAAKDAIVSVQMKTFRYVSWASNGVSPTLLKLLSDQVDEDLHTIDADILKLASRDDLTEAQKWSLQDLVSKWKNYENSAKDAIEVGSTDAPMATMMLGQADEKFMALASDLHKLSSSAVAQTDAISVVLHTDAGQKKLILGVGAAIGLLLSLVITTLVSRSIVNPIRSVTDAMRQLSSGDTEVEVGYRGRRDEIGQMVEAIQVFRKNAIEMRALGEIGQAVNSSLDLQEVLLKIVTYAVRLSKAKEGTIYEYDEATEVFEPRANFGSSESMIQALHESRIRLGDTSVGRCALDRAPVQLPDVAAESSYRLRELLMSEGISSVLAVPLLREEQVIGALVIRRDEVGEFPSELIVLLQTFAAQSVLAILNARLFKEIHEKSEQLAAASQLKSQFLANMSHELRTPLNAIIGVTEMLHEDAVDLKRNDDLEPLERVLRAARHLLALINDILDLSKIEAGKIDIHLESFPIAPLVEDVLQTLATMASKNGNEMVVNCAADIGTMHADQMRIRQALLNLVSNANKFTEHGTVTIDARRSINQGREWMELAVTDTGIGLTTEQMGKLFQDFVQADASVTRKYGGTGLGLAISRRFCQMMGGDITVKSEAGRGSTFTMRVPVDAVVHALPAPAAQREAAPSARQAGTAAQTILVVDDDQTVREVMERFLTREGFSVVTAEGGQEALKKAREARPAAITLDIMMPDIDGWTVLAAIKGDPELKDIPVILVSIIDEKKRGYSLGATDYMVKPVDRAVLSEALRRICSSGRYALLVDDDEATRLGMRTALEHDGWRVAEAANGRIALEQLTLARPDVILLDLMMPEMNGFEFLTEMRASVVWRDIPVVVVTAKDLTTQERKRLNCDVERVLQKGGSGLDELLAEIGRVLVDSIARSSGKECAPSRETAKDSA